ncbi:MAG: cytochrome P450 [Sandaracinaceae bacterium]|nr:cytochrome P450 [Sandaracinaceae bacterium]
MHLDSVPLLSGSKFFVGHNLELQRERMRFLDRIAEENAPMLRLRAPAAHLVVINDPQILQEVFVEKAKSFHKSMLVKWALYPLAGEGLFTSEGDLWRRQRKLMAPLFHQAQLQRYATDMLACTHRTMDPWKDGDVVEFANAMTKLTMGVAGKTLFDADTFDDADAIGEALTDTLEWIGEASGSFYGIAHLVARRLVLRAAEVAPATLSARLSAAAQRLAQPTWIPGERGKKFRASIAFLDQHVQRMIDERRASAGQRDDLLSKLLSSRDEESGAGMNDKQVRDEVLTLFVAGHETTATGLSWSLQLLCEHPDWYAKVQKEVDALPADPTVADLPALGLCLRVFKESLRLYPPVYMFGRQTLEPVEVGGVTLPQDTVVLLSPYTLHHMRSVWPDPKRFDPDRFLPEAEASRARYSWLPFGAGPRVCIGNHFAMMEAQLVLATLLRRYRFESLGHAEPETSATFRPNTAMPMRVHARKTS